MGKILLSYEFGHGFGHINRLLEVAKQLDSRHELFIAMPDRTIGQRALERFPRPITAIEGVSWSPLPRQDLSSIPTDTFADAIRLYGYAEFERLLLASSRWQEILSRVSPDLVIADWAPTLRLAAHPRIPMVVVGNGYTIPPAARLLPPIRPWVADVSAKSRIHEAQLLAAANQLRDHMSAPAIDFFADLFQGEQTYICTIPEFDPYRESRGAELTWPFNVPIQAESEGGDRPVAAFAYLQHDHPSLAKVLSALNTLDRNCELYISGGDPRKFARLCSPKIKFHLIPADFKIVLHRSQLLIHHAGLGTAYAGLTAGIPQLVLPVRLEHAITARGLKQFGSCMHCNFRIGLGDLKKILDESLNSFAIKQAASMARALLEARRPKDPITEIVSKCEAYV